MTSVLNPSLSQPQHLLDSAAAMQKYADQKETVGALVCTRIQAIVAAAVALQKMTKLAVNHGAGLTCAGTTIATGLGHLYSGDVFKGTFLTAAGAKEIYNILNKENNRQEVMGLLNNAGAGIDMIQTLEVANGESLKTVDKNLDLVRNNVKRLNHHLSLVKNIATEGSEELKVQKKKASRLYKEANKLFAQAQEKFEISQKRIEKSSSTFEKALEGFSDLYKLANQKDDNEKTLDAFIKLATKIHRQCKAAQDVLEDGNGELNEGIELLNQAIEKQQEAAVEAGIALCRAKSRLDTIKHQEVEKAYEEKIETIQTELNSIKARHADVLTIIPQTQQNIEQAKEIVEGGYNNADLLMAGVGATAGNALLGPVVGIPLGVAASVAIKKNHMAVADYVFGIKEEQPKAPVNHEVISYQFDQHSCGYWGRYVAKRQSWTVGTIFIRIGECLMNLRFNLNKKESLSDKDLFRIQCTLADQLNKGLISPTACLKIIDQLETNTLDRGIKQVVKKGFISPNSVYFSEIRRVCLAKIGQ